jgi:hypothetical protein
MIATNIADLRPLIELALKLELGLFKVICVDGISNKVEVMTGRVIFIFDVVKPTIRDLVPGDEVTIDLVTGLIKRK